MASAEEGKSPPPTTPVPSPSGSSKSISKQPLKRDSAGKFISSASESDSRTDTPRKRSEKKKKDSAKPRSEKPRSEEFVTQSQFSLLLSQQANILAILNKKQPSASAVSASAVSDSEYVPSDIENLDSVSLEAQKMLSPTSARSATGENLDAVSLESERSSPTPARRASGKNLKHGSLSPAQKLRRGTTILSVAGDGSITRGPQSQEVPCRGIELSDTGENKPSRPAGHGPVQNSFGRGRSERSAGTVRGPVSKPVIQRRAGTADRDGVVQPRPASGLPGCSRTSEAGESHRSLPRPTATVQSGLPDDGGRRFCRGSTTELSEP